MANTLSAIKRVRQNLKHRARNQARRSRMRTFVRHADAKIAEGDSLEAAQAVRKAISEIDRAVQRGALRANNAARRKSRLMKRLGAINSSPPL